MMKTAPIAVFAFNRPDLLARTLTALAANGLANKSSLTVFCDGPRNEEDEAGTQAVRKLARAATGFAELEVVERPRNMGCAASVIDGLTEMFRRHERLIVIEDDILTSPYTLRFLNEGLARYADNERVFNICAWTPPQIVKELPADYSCDVYAIPRFNVWGWASWRDRFQDIDWEVTDYHEFKNTPHLRRAFDAGGEDLSPMLDDQMEGKLDTWDIRADYARFKKRMLGINPVRSYTLNIGMGSGTHTTTATTYWDSDISQAVEPLHFPEKVEVDPRIQRIYHDCYPPHTPTSPLSTKTILSINTTPSGGGAAAVTQQVRRLMAQQGMRTSLLTGWPAPGEDNALQSVWRKSDGLRLWCEWHGLQDYHIQKSHRLADHPLFQQADLVHLHNLHGGYFNLWSLPHLTARKPTVWTLHDMWALTGHCSHALECERWLPQIGCGACPHLDLHPGIKHDATRRIWQDKRTVYAHSSLYLVTPSIWLQRLVEKSILREHPLACIPNGVDTSIYKPMEKAKARQRLGLPQYALLVGGCADGGLNNPWKGGEYIVQAVLALKKEFPELVFLNIGSPDAPPELQTGWVRNIPYVHDEQELACLYSALDLLLYPTLADNHPLVCIESLCCGTPIVGFATGGVPEIVRHGHDGLLVPTHAGEDLIHAAAQLLRDESLRRRMGQDAAADAAQLYSLELFASRYEKVYEEALRRPIPAQTGQVPLHAVPTIIRGRTFMRQHRKMYPSPSPERNRSLKLHRVTGDVYQRLCSCLGRFRCVKYLVRFIHRCRRT